MINKLETKRLTVLECLHFRFIFHKSIALKYVPRKIMVTECSKTIHLVSRCLTLRKQKGLVLNILFCREIMISSASPATSQITTQRFIISYECLANSSGLLLKSYNLNQPISINLCTAPRLMVFTSPACTASFPSRW